MTRCALSSTAWIVFYLFSSVPAIAAVIHNLSEKIQVIEVYTEGRYHPVNIEAGRAWRTIGMAKIRYLGREWHIGYDEEYALWKGGDFGPQKMINKHRD